MTLHSVDLGSMAILVTTRHESRLKMASQGTLSVIEAAAVEVSVVFGFPNAVQLLSHASRYLEKNRNSEPRLWS
jgi:hypothetical protein